MKFKTYKLQLVTKFLGYSSYLLEPFLKTPDRLAAEHRVESHFNTSFITTAEILWREQLVC